MSKHNVHGCCSSWRYSQIFNLLCNCWHYFFTSHFILHLTVVWMTFMAAFLPSSHILSPAPSSFATSNYLTAFRHSLLSPSQSSPFCYFSSLTSEFTSGAEYKRHIIVYYILSHSWCLTLSSKMLWNYVSTIIFRWWAVDGRSESAGKRYHSMPSEGTLLT